MSETAKPETCLWACWGVGALAGVVALWQVFEAFPVLAALMFSGAFAVLIAIAVSRAVCVDKGMKRNLGLAMGLEIDDSYKDETETVSPAPVPADKGADARPPKLGAARDGQPDDLKKIKGIGPALETLCHELGITHYDQIAAWGPDEIAWMDDNLEGFRGRVSRDDWVSQARTLCDDAETQASKRGKSATDGAA